MSLSLSFMSFNVDKCYVMHIGHNMQSNYNMPNQQLPTTDQQRDLKAAKRPTEYWVSLPAISGTKTKN